MSHHRAAVVELHDHSPMVVAKMELPAFLLPFRVQKSGAYSCTSSSRSLGLGVAANLTLLGMLVLVALHPHAFPALFESPLARTLDQQLPLPHVGQICDPPALLAASDCALGDQPFLFGTKVCPPLPSKPVQQTLYGLLLRYTDHRACSCWGCMTCSSPAAHCRLLHDADDSHVHLRDWSAASESYIIFKLHSTPPRSAPRPEDPTICACWCCTANFSPTASCVHLRGRFAASVIYIIYNLYCRFNFYFYCNVNFNYKLRQPTRPACVCWACSHGVAIIRFMPVAQPACCFVRTAAFVFYNTYLLHPPSPRREPRSSDPPICTRWGCKMSFSSAAQCVHLGGRFAAPVLYVIYYCCFNHNHYFNVYFFHKLWQPTRPAYVRWACSHGDVLFRFMPVAQPACCFARSAASVFYFIYNNYCCFNSYFDLNVYSNYKLFWQPTSPACVCWACSHGGAFFRFMPVAHPACGFVIGSLRVLLRLPHLLLHPLSLRLEHYLQLHALATYQPCLRVRDLQPWRCQFSSHACSPTCVRLCPVGGLRVLLHLQPLLVPSLLPQLQRQLQLQALRFHFYFNHNCNLRGRVVASAADSSFLLSAACSSLPFYVQ